MGENSFNPHKEVLSQYVKKDRHADVQAICDKLQKLIDESRYDADIFVGGSFAKGTYLEGDFDVDIFVRFAPKKYAKKDISDITEKIFMSLDLTRLAGSRDYFQAKVDGYQLELVPVLDIANPADALNITDCSPLHVQWITQRIAQTPGLADEIRLFKLFCKSAKAYGAESYLAGFSGHVVDILVAHFGSFMETVKQLVRLKPMVLINPNMKTTQDDLSLDAIMQQTGLNADKVAGPMVIVDPIDASRNAAAALGMEKYASLREHASAYLEQPSAWFFEPHPLDEDQMRQDHKHVVKLGFATLEGKKDVVGSKVLKCITDLITRLREHGFCISGFVWNFDAHEHTAVCYIFTDKADIPEAYVFPGPPLDKHEHVEAFAQMHAETFEKDGRIHARERRSYTHILEAVRDLLRYDEKRIHSVAVQKL